MAGVGTRYLKSATHLISHTWLLQTLVFSKAPHILAVPAAHPEAWCQSWQINVNPLSLRVPPALSGS